MCVCERESGRAKGAGNGERGLHSFAPAQANVCTYWALTPCAAAATALLSPPVSPHDTLDPALDTRSSLMMYVRGCAENVTYARVCMSTR